jgi:hypothetical protein
MIVVVSRRGSILGADDTAVASISSPRASDWINHVHPDDRGVAQNLLERSDATHIEFAVIRSAWPRIGYRKARCAAVAIEDFILLELLALDDRPTEQFRETEAVVLAVAHPARDDMFGDAVIHVYRSMLVGALRTNLPDFDVTRGAEVAVLTQDWPCTEVIPMHPVLARQARFITEIGTHYVEVAGRVTAVSLRQHAIEYRTDSGPPVILPRSDR